MFGRLSPLWLYGFFGKLGVPSYTTMKTLMLWITLSPFGSYLFIQLKEIMTAIRVLETQLIGKEEELDEFGHLYLSCWMQVLMSGGTTHHLTWPDDGVGVEANYHEKDE